MADDVPGLDDKFRVPRNNNDLQLLNAARAFATDALPLKAQFIALELPPDFLEDLNGGIEAMQAAISDQSGGLTTRVTSGAAIDDAIGRGIEVVRKLGAIIKNKYGANPAVLAEWTSVSHITSTFIIGPLSGRPADPAKLWLDDPGVSLRSTPGFMPSSAPRTKTGSRQAYKVVRE